MEAGITIIMKVWNAPAYVRLCLETLLENTTSPFELVIIDNGSKERLKDYLRGRVSSGKHLQLVENSSNRGPGYANRQGASLAKYGRLCLLDSDVLVPPGWLERLSAEMDAQPEVKLLSAMKPEAHIAYPFTIDGEDSGEAWAASKLGSRDLSPLEQFLDYSKGLQIGEFEQAVLRANPNAFQVLESPPDFTGTCCALVDRDFVEHAGGVADPVFHTYGSEDVDLCWRIAAAGGQAAKSGEVYVHHFQGASLAGNQVDRTNALADANRILYNKWRAPLLALVVEKARLGFNVSEYLESHFIFQALARFTPFIPELREVLNDPGLADEW